MTLIKEMTAGTRANVKRLSYTRVCVSLACEDPSALIMFLCVGSPWAIKLDSGFEARLLALT